MANTNRPNGLSPVKSLVSGGYNGQGNLYAIQSDASNTYALGDVVMAAAGSTATGIPNVIKWGGATTTSALPVGIIVGFATPPATNSLVGTPLELEQQWLELNAGLKYVYVVDDPNVVFEVQFDSTAIVAADLNKNASVTVTANQTSTLSQSSPYSSTVLTAPATTATLPIRLLGAVQTVDNEVGAYVRVLAKWNYHALGVTAGASGTVPGYLAP
jgi:hypothetical protein